jgi:hypothetical protein
VDYQERGRGGQREGKLIPYVIPVFTRPLYEGGGNTGKIEMEPADKPGSVEDDHSSGTPVTGRLVRPTRRHLRAASCASAGLPIWSCSRGGLPSRCRYRQRGALLPHRFTLTCAPVSRRHRRFAFCCTFRRLAPPRRYLASCPEEPGLSSATGLGDRDRLAGSGSHTRRRTTR